MIREYEVACKSFQIPEHMATIQLSRIWRKFSFVGGLDSYTSQGQSLLLESISPIYSSQACMRLKGSKTMGMAGT